MDGKETDELITKFLDVHYHHLRNEYNPVVLGWPQDFSPEMRIAIDDLLAQLESHYGKRAGFHSIDYEDALDVLDCRPTAVPDVFLEEGDVDTL